MEIPGCDLFVKHYRVFTAGFFKTNSQNPMIWAMGRYFLF